MAKESKKNGHTVLTGEDVGFDIKVTWLGINRMFAPLAAEKELTTTTGFVLLNISSEHGAPATKIAPLLGMEPRSLTRLLKKLEEDKLIQRIPDPEDGRSVVIKLTEKGKQMKKVARKNVDAFNEEIKRSIPTSKLRTFFDVLHHIHSITEKNRLSVK